MLKHPAPELVFTGFGASSMDFSLRYWIKLGTPGSKVKSDLFFALEAGVPAARNRDAVSRSRTSTCGAGTGRPAAGPRRRATRVRSRESGRGSED